MKELELLAPAKNLEYGIAAINAGADAVYIGARAFGARKAAGNSIEDIAELARYAHKYYAKVYATVNTIFDNSEIDAVRRLICELHTAGIDALIIQDLGILKMDLPNIPIFASTQTNNYDLERIQFIEAAGVSRIILARELSIQQIKKISKQTNCELESFIFGALCVSLSGQCYMSQAVCGRSANRGECAQMCRHQYSLLDITGKTIIKNKFLLSLKDLNLENKLESMIDAGITSFKIEGRLKDISYLTNATAYFRKKLDDIITNRIDLKKSSSGNIEIKFHPDLSRAFNRGFTEYFINGKSDTPANINTPKSIGEKIGNAVTAKNRQVLINSKIQINTGDGLSYYDNNGELCGFRVNKAEGNLLHLFEPIKLKSGTELYRNQDIVFDKSIGNNPPERKIDVNIYFSDIGNGFRITAIDEDNNTAEHMLNIDKIIADNPEKAEASIKKQLSKSGGTIFKINPDFSFSSMTEVEDGEIAKDSEFNSASTISNVLPTSNHNDSRAIANTYFISISELNSARRELLEKLEIERIANYQKPQSIGKSVNSKFDNIKPDYSLNIMNSLAEEFYSERITTEGQLQYAPEATKDYDGVALMTTKYCIRKQVGLCPKIDKHIKSADSLILKDKANEYRLEFDCSKCMMKIFLKDTI